MKTGGNESESRGDALADLLRRRDRAQCAAVAGTVADRPQESHHILRHARLRLVGDVGIEGNAPKSLDIRTEQGTAVEQALLGNVYETLVSRSDTNKLQPGIASSWQISDDGLTYRSRCATA